MNFCEFVSDEPELHYEAELIADTNNILSCQVTYGGKFGLDLTSFDLNLVDEMGNPISDSEEDDLDVDCNYIC